MVYFIQERSSVIGKGRIKIGYSRDPLRRIKELRPLNGGPIFLLAIEPGGYYEEWLAHDRFSHCRIWGTEWFWPTTDLVLYLVSGIPGWRGYDSEWDSSSFLPLITETRVLEEISIARELEAEEKVFGD